jgi:hypothetical protein
VTGGATLAGAFLEESLGGDAQQAQHLTVALARRVEYLTWSDRARVLDEFFWTEAHARLPIEIVTAVVNRQPSAPGAPLVVAYARLCTHVLTGTLLALDEPIGITAVEQALTYALSRSAEHQEAALEWIRATGCPTVQDHLTRLPGYAFLLLTASESDSAETFMARDAFWAAVLGGR